MLKDNSNLKNSLAEYALSQKEFFNFKTTEGINLNGWMMKPHNYDETKAIPSIYVLIWWTWFSTSN